MKPVVNAFVIAGLTLTMALVAGFVSHGLWLVFLYGWDTVK